MWIDPHIGDALKLSDALGNALIEANVTGASFKPVEKILGKLGDDHGS